MSRIRVALAQVAPVWLDRAATLEKVKDAVNRAADEGAQLVVFGEGLVPGYPFWPELTGGAEFESGVQKEMFAHYAEQAVDVAGGGLTDLCYLAASRGIALYLGCIERATERSGHSLYACLAYIAPDGTLGSTHRKLMPTHEERLVWSPGDGHGLRVHDLHGFRVGGLNCWENWMPLPRAALYAQGENLHVAAWPGNRRNTLDITRFLAREGRSYVLSVSGLMHRDWIPDAVPHAQAIREAAGEWMADGGSCIAGPDGEWVIEPVTGEETLLTAELDLNLVYRERQNFDPAGHYARPDVTRLLVDRRRQGTAEFKDD
ncbi:MAG: carbon-nitrogen hydrolase family protein [Gammaproteobacteria bacterium]|nr:carbon-nitrogen hydrolase family protein [Gammaproteobacteria bacterium]